MGLSPDEERRFLKALEEVEAEVDALAKDIGELKSDVIVLKRDVRDVKATLENITMIIEVEANNLVQYYLRQRGIGITTGPVQFDSEYEFSIYGINGQLTIVGEAKVRVGPAVIDDVVGRVKDAVKRFPGKFPGRVVYCLRALQDAVEEARKLGIWLIEDGNEVTPFPGQILDKTQGQ